MLVANNKLTTLDLSANNKLEKLEADHNQLTGITLNATKKFVKCLLHSNQLGTEAIDDLFAKLPDITTVTLDSDIPYHKTVTVFENPGAIDCNSMLAVNKGWIVEKDTPAGVATTKAASELSIRKDGSMLRIGGIEEGTAYTLFSLSGYAVATGTATTSETVIDASALSKGVYILKAGAHSVKVML